jgi:hypothetical protein
MAYIPEANTSVSHGTMRSQDLLRAFATELEHILPDQLPDTVASACRIADLLDEDDCVMETQWEASDMLDKLFTLLDEHAPEGCYFGSHPGDGSDYGYWEAE